MWIGCLLRIRHWLKHHSLFWLFNHTLSSLSFYLIFLFFMVINNNFSLPMFPFILLSYAYWLIMHVSYWIFAYLLICDCTHLDFQMDVVRCFSDAEGPQWKHSLFGNPQDPETFRFVQFSSFKSKLEEFWKSSCSYHSLWIAWIHEHMLPSLIA